MSGHSRWSTIKRKKEKTDAIKGKIFTKIGRELAVAAREGGGDLNSNFKLRECVAKAKAFNVPSDNIERIINKAIGGDDSQNFEVVSYEGYGPGGVAFMVDILTDNRNRTASNIRRYFDKSGGNLGTPGCVAFMFNPKGLIEVSKEGVVEEKFLEDVFNLGVSDFESEEDAESFLVITQKSDYETIKNKLLEKKYKIVSSEISMVPDSYIEIKDENLKERLQKLIDNLEVDDDVQNVWCNCEFTN